MKIFIISTSALVERRSGSDRLAQELFAQSRRIRFSAEPGFVEVGNGYSSALFLRTLAGDSGAVERFKQDLSIDSLDP